MTYVLEEEKGSIISIGRVSRLRTSNDLSVDPNPQQWSYK